MNLEYLIVGIARENPDDLKEFVKATKGGAFALALAYTKDRFLARAVAVEAYRRVIKYAYKFDTDMNAEYWLLDIVKNLSLNALCDGEIAKLAAENHTENISTLLRQAIMETDEDRGKIIALRVGSELSKSEVARLLWYNKASSDGEFIRGIKQLADMAPEERDAAGVREQLAEDIEECTPDILALVQDTASETVVSKVSHKNFMVGDDELALPGETKENRRDRIEAKKAEARKKKIVTACIVASVIVVIVAAGLVWWFFENRSTELTDPESSGVTVKQPQFNTRVALAEKDGVLYFQNLADGGALYSINMKDSGSTPVKISDHEPKELLISGDYIYYRNDNDGKLYRRAIGSAAGAESEKFDVNGAVLKIQGDKIYFSSSSGISRMDLDGSDVELLYDTTNDTKLLREDIEVAEDGTVYFSSGYEKGLFALVEENGEFVKSELDKDHNIYDFLLVGKDIFFDDVSGNNAKTGKIYRLAEDEKGNLYMSTLSAITLSAAFAESDGYIYYYGCKTADSWAGTVAEKGIYRVYANASSDDGKVGGEPQLVVSLEGREYDVSDMYISGGVIYCYFCNGEATAAGNAYMALEAFALEDGNASQSKVIFSAEKK